MNLIISLISLAFDILLLNVFKFGNYNISFFYPMFTITSIIYISNNYTNANRKNYYAITAIVACFYDALVLNNLLISLFLFESIAITNILLKRVLNNSLFNNILRLIISIFLYDTLFHLLLVIVKYQKLNFSSILYKSSHSLILNVLYISIMFLVLKKRKA